MPRPVIQRAQEVLSELEEGRNDRADSSPRRSPFRRRTAIQFSFLGANHALLEELASLEIDGLTPLQAITKLYELREKARGRRAKRPPLLPGDAGHGGLVHPRAQRPADVHTAPAVPVRRVSVGQIVTRKAQQLADVVVAALGVLRQEQRRQARDEGSRERRPQRLRVAVAQVGAEHVHPGAATAISGPQLLNEARAAGFSWSKEPTAITCR